MNRSLPPASPAGESGAPRCPECGSGDLFLIEITRQQGDVWRGAYCAGEYNRERRRVVRRSCGYAGESRRADEARPPDAALLQPAEPVI
jgi:transposase